MGEELELEIISNVQRHVENILASLFLDTAGHTIVVERMGSREYGCAVKSSDLDLYVIIHNDWLGHAKVIRVLLAAALEKCGEAKDGKEAPVDQTENCTLKWTHPCGLDVSLLVAVDSVVRDAVSATRCLKWYFARDKVLYEIVRETVGRLRKKGVLNTHGRKGSVNQSLKTTSAVLLCVALMNAGGCDRGATSEELCVWLLSALSTFDGTAFRVCYDYTDERVCCYKGRSVQYGGRPLRIIRGSPRLRLLLLILKRHSAEAIV